MVRAVSNKPNRTIQKTTYYQIDTVYLRDETGVRVCRECHSECAVMLAESALIDAVKGADGMFAQIASFAV